MRGWRWDFEMKSFSYWRLYWNESLPIAFLQQSHHIITFPYYHTALHQGSFLTLSLDRLHPISSHLYTIALRFSIEAGFKAITKQARHWQVASSRNSSLAWEQCRYCYCLSLLLLVATVRRLTALLLFIDCTTLRSGYGRLFSKTWLLISMIRYWSKR